MALMFFSIACAGWGGAKMCLLPANPELWMRDPHASCLEGLSETERDQVHKYMAYAALKLVEPIPEQGLWAWEVIEKQRELVAAGTAPTETAMVVAALRMEQDILRGVVNLAATGIALFDSKPAKTAIEMVILNHHSTRTVIAIRGEALLYCGGEHCATVQVNLNERDLLRLPPGSSDVRYVRVVYNATLMRTPPARIDTLWKPMEISFSDGGSIGVSGLGTGPK
jgi:hypothetical protein